MTETPEKPSPGDQAGDDAGESVPVRLTFNNEVRVPAVDPLTYEEWLMPVACPQCGATTGITLQVRYEHVIGICPREDCGRAWPTDLVSASQLRQMHHLWLPGQSVTLPHPHQVTVDLVPELEDDLVLEDDPRPDDGSPPDPETRWSISVATVEHAAPLVVSMAWARGLLSWALPADGTLYERLYPPAGGSVLDAHMTQVVLGLAIHETARTQEAYEIKMLTLDAVAHQLADDRAPHLRATRPVGLGEDGGRLRRSDAARLAGATQEQWTRWHGLAQDVLAEHCRQDLRRKAAGALPLAEWLSPRPTRLGSCRPDLPALDLAWYQGDVGVR